MTTLLQWDPAHDTAISKFREEGIDIPCLMPWRFLFIQEHTKKVFGCCFHKRPYGDLTRDNLEEIWNGNEAQEMRRSLLAKRVPKYCLNNSAACPIIHDLHVNRKTVDFESDIIIGQNDFWTLDEGWHPFEAIPEPVRWTRQVARAHLDVQNFRAVRIEAMTMIPTVDAKPVTGEVLMNGIRLGAIQLRDCSWQNLIFAIPAAVRDQAEEDGQVRAVLEIRLDETWRPSLCIPGNGDTRDLGIAVRRIRVFADAGTFEKPLISHSEKHQAKASRKKLLAHERSDRPREHLP